MSVYLGYNTMTKQYLKDLISGEGRVVREWMDYYVNVTNTVFKYPHGIANFPCFVRNDEIKEGTKIIIKTVSFDDVTIAQLSNTMLDVRARFITPNKSVFIKDFTSVDLSSKFSVSVLNDSATKVSCFVVDESFDVSDAKGAKVFQIGVKFKTGISDTPEMTALYAIE